MQPSTLKFLFSFLIYFDIAGLRNASTTTLLMLKVDQCLLSLTCECVHNNAQQCTGFRNFIMLELSNAHSNFWSLFSFLIYTWVVKFSRHTHWWSLPTPVHHKLPARSTVLPRCVRQTQRLHDEECLSLGSIVQKYCGNMIFFLCCCVPKR